ncbi:CPBP family intramembrane glutamic endopeptidase [Streptomyces mirabilis]
MPFFVGMLVAGPLSEEPGWRGTAYPRMRASLCRLQAGLLLGAVWAVWHVPLFFVRGTLQMENSVHDVSTSPQRQGEKTASHRPLQLMMFHEALTWNLPLTPVTTALLSRRERPSFWSAQPHRDRPVIDPDTIASLPLEDYHRSLAMAMAAGRMAESEARRRGHGRRSRGPAATGGGGTHDEGQVDLVADGHDLRSHSRRPASLGPALTQPAGRVPPGTRRRRPSRRFARHL